MMIDEKVTIGSILNAIREGNKAEHVARAIDGISQKPFLAALKDAGYAYSNKAPKGWHYMGEGEEPLDKSIFDYVKSSSHKVTQGNKHVKQSNIEVKDSNMSVNKGNEEVNSVSLVVHPQFTQDEISDIVEMLHEWRSKKLVQESTQVHERIKTLAKGDKTRKTIVIDATIAQRLDEYCETERVNKSDVLHLALIDFFKSN